jgi:putative phosphoesterase
MKILHISDSHISASHFHKEALKKSLSELKKERYDLFVHSGDITQSGKLEEYKKAQKIFKKINIPKIFVPGNHDKRSGGISMFKNFIGKTNGVRDLGDSVIIYVDSGVADTNDGRVGMTKFNMIKENLKKYQQKEKKILVLHHHIVPTPRAGRERNVLSNAGDILDLILRYDVDLVLLGHKHYPNVYKIENTVFANAGTVSDKKTRHGDVNSYNTIVFDKEKVGVSIKRINNTEIKKSYSRLSKRYYYDFGEKKCRIAHMSNSFISTSNKFKYINFINAVKKINKSNVDLVVHCGGIVEEGIQRNYETAYKYLSQIEPKIIYTPAGRDINYLGYHLFPEYFGEIDQSYEIKNILFQGISSSQYDSKIGIIGRTERENLFKKINDNENEMKCLFLHHNVMPILHSREKGLLEDSGDLLKNIVDNSISLVLTGTSSHAYALKIEGSIIVNANSISSVYQRSVHGNSFNFIDIYEKVIVVYEINSLWGTRRILGIWER